MTHRYAHLFDDPLRAAVERVGAAVVGAGKSAPDKIVPLEKPLKKGRGAP
jgi:hypothetical protein